MTIEPPHPNNMGKTPEYFSDLNLLGASILHSGVDIFDYSREGYVHDYVEEHSLNTRNLLVERMDGNEVFLRQGVLIGLVAIDFIKKEHIRLGINTLTRTFQYNPNDTDSPGYEFVTENVDKVIRKQSVYGLHSDELRPVTDSLRHVVNNFDPYSEEYYPKESIWRGYVLGINTVIAMCDDWTEWTEEVRTKTFQSRSE